LKVMLPVYYRLRDWDENGVPRPARLEQLDMT
jgi:aldehyde:ferredoxin oxidoreductase